MSLKLLELVVGLRDREVEVLKLFPVGARFSLGILIVWLCSGKKKFAIFRSGNVRGCMASIQCQRHTLVTLPWRFAVNFIKASLAEVIKTIFALDSGHSLRALNAFDKQQNIIAHVLASELSLEYSALKDNERFAIEFDLHVGVQCLVN